MNQDLLLTSHCGTNAYSEVVDESIDQSNLEVVEKTDVGIESDLKRIKN